jgi:serine/threonine protein kinase
VVHRDIKPDNIVLACASDGDDADASATDFAVAAASGSVRVVDFGGVQVRSSGLV